MEYYQHDLALIHARGFGEYADRCALVDTSLIPVLLASCGVTATVTSAFGTAELPPGLRAVTGVRS